MMHVAQYRNCPLCNKNANSLAFPYCTVFGGIKFNYVRCEECSTVYVDPIPSNKIFACMYEKKTYHDNFYDNVEVDKYLELVAFLKQYIASDAKILDYGCGTGNFLKALSLEGIDAYGVEFDSDAASSASIASNCPVETVNGFSLNSTKTSFDAIYMGDVLEHLPDPESTLGKVLSNLKYNGVFIVEGPLEINPSPVYWSASIFGWFKHLLIPNLAPNTPPHHLYFTGAQQQRDFFNRIDQGLYLKYWHVHETGWPYIEGGLVKRTIAKISILIGGKNIGGSVFGNRFRAVFIKK